MECIGRFRKRYMWNNKINYDEQSTFEFPHEYFRNIDRQFKKRLYELAIKKNSTILNLLYIPTYSIDYIHVHLLYDKAKSSTFTQTEWSFENKIGVQNNAEDVIILTKFDNLKKIIYDNKKQAIIRKYLPKISFATITKIDKRNLIVNNDGYIMIKDAEQDIKFKTYVLNLLDICDTFDTINSEEFSYFIKKFNAVNMVYGFGFLMKLLDFDIIDTNLFIGCMNILYNVLDQHQKTTSYTHLYIEQHTEELPIKVNLIPFSILSQPEIYNKINQKIEEGSLIKVYKNSNFDFEWLSLTSIKQLLRLSNAVDEMNIVKSFPFNTQISYIDILNCYSNSFARFISVNTELSIYFTSQQLKYMYFTFPFEFLNNNDIFKIMLERYPDELVKLYASLPFSNEQITHLINVINIKPLIVYTNCITDGKLSVATVDKTAEVTKLNFEIYKKDRDIDKFALIRILRIFINLSYMKQNIKCIKIFICLFKNSKLKIDFIIF